MSNYFVNKLKAEKKDDYFDGIYGQTQVMMAYRSNDLSLSREQVESILQTHTLTVEVGEKIPYFDVLTAVLSFTLFDFMLDTLDRPLDANLIAEFETIMSNRYHEVCHVDVSELLEDTEGLQRLYWQYIDAGGNKCVARMLFYRQCLLNDDLLFLLTDVNRFEAFLCELLGY